MNRYLFQTASKDLFWLVKVHNVWVVGGQLNTSSSKAYINSLQKTVSVIGDFSLSVHVNEFLVLYHRSILSLSVIFTPVAGICKPIFFLVSQ